VKKTLGGIRLKKTLTFLGLLFAVTVVVATLCADAPPIYAQEPIGEAGDNIGVQNETYELEVIHLVNQERVSRGLHPLRLNNVLTNAARDHNQDMINNEFFDHLGSDGSWPWDRACNRGYAPYGWGDCYVAENIAGAQTTPAQVFNAWMNSPNHRDNMLDPDYREIGVGHATGGPLDQYWTMDLGSQPMILPVFINNDDSETGSRQVTITLTKEDVSNFGSIGTITGVQISEDPTFAGATWQPWSQTIPHTLSQGNGTKTVYVKFTDGSTEVISSDAITLSELVPSLSLSTNNITFLAEVGSTQTMPSIISFAVNNNGGDVLHWTASDDSAWLVLGSTGGDAPDTVDVWVDNSGGILNTLGENIATITVTATNPDAVNTPQFITVQLSVVEEVHATYLPLILR
jgi:uncharacterized protein YkwD